MVETTPTKKNLQPSAAQYNKLDSALRQKIDNQALSLPMCAHLSRETLKSFLLKEARIEDVESAEDSILGKWAQIAKKSKTWMEDESVGLMPTLIDDCLLSPFKTEGFASDS